MNPDIPAITRHQLTNLGAEPNSYQNPPDPETEDQARADEAAQKKLLAARLLHVTIWTEVHDAKADAQKKLAKKSEAASVNLMETTLGLKPRPGHPQRPLPSSRRSPLQTGRWPTPRRRRSEPSSPAQREVYK